jgi:predicted house-cleaning noncanonical NTP pyrophosphatase (MazG superfamily)/diadenosine tetraphosphate (Ap4A) HIT family hydrolase
MAIECCFCENERFDFIEKLGLPSKESVLFEDKNLIVAPDLVPVICGHLLIITKKHIGCFGESDKNILDSLQNAKEFIKTRIFPNSSVVFFEHGAVVKHSGGGCIDHAHQHAVPKFDPISEEYIDKFIKDSGFVPNSKIKLKDDTLKQFYIKKQPYIFYEIDNVGWAYAVDRLPTQFLKMMFAPFMSYNYNWKISYNTDASKEMFLRTLNFAKKNIELSKREKINKLVRDNIINIIEQDGRKPIYTKLSDDKYFQLLCNKLLEESNEYILSNEIEELADILEVVYSIAKFKHIAVEDIEKIRESKKNKNGSFDDKIFLEEIIHN